MVSPQLLGERRLFGSASDSCHTEAHAARELNAQMAEATDPLDCHEITRPATRVPKRVERRHAGAKQGRRVARGQLVGNGCQTAFLGNHHLGVAAIVADAGNRLILAVHEVAAPARCAAAAMSAEKTHTHPLAEFPVGNPVAQSVDRADHFMAGDARVGDTGGETVDGEGVGMTNPARLNPNSDLPRWWRDQLSIYELQFARRGHLSGAIVRRCHCRLLKFLRLSFLVMGGDKNKYICKYY
jgi:hypothetical protein